MLPFFPFREDPDKNFSHKASCKDDNSDYLDQAQRFLQNAFNGVHLRMVEFGKTRGRESSTSQYSSESYGRKQPFGHLSL